MPSWIERILALICLTLLIAACAGGDTQVLDLRPTEPQPSPTPTERPAPEATDPTADPVATKATEPAADPPNLIPASELVSNCLSFPEEEITPDNSVGLMLGVTEGRPAIEFSLFGTDGSLHTLSGLLRTKPVLIILGGLT
jgi:hypothetical protein